MTHLFMFNSCYTKNSKKIYFSKRISVFYKRSKTLTTYTRKIKIVSSLKKVYNKKFQRFPEMLQKLRFPNYLNKTNFVFTNNLNQKQIENVFI